MPDDVTTTWWRKDRDPADAVRRLQPERPRPHDRGGLLGAGHPDGTVSTPIRWDEVDDVVPDDFTIATVPARYAELGDLHAGIDDAVFAIDQLLEWAERDERDGAAEPPEPDAD